MSKSSPVPRLREVKPGSHMINYSSPTCLHTSAAFANAAFANAYKVDFMKLFFLTR